MGRLSIGAKVREEEARLSRDRRLRFEQRADFHSYTSRLRSFDIQWQGKTSRMNKPWDHATDFNPPLTYSKVEDVHAVLFGFLSELNFFSVAASEGGNLPEETIQEQGELQTGLLKWSLLNETNGVAFLDQFAHDGLTFGSGFGEVGWKRDIRTIQAEFFIPPEMSKSGRTDDSKLIKDILGERLRSKSLKQVSKGKYQADFMDEDSLIKSGVMWIDRDNPNREADELTLIIQREWTFANSPDLIRIAPWDMMVPTDVTDLQTARRYWVRRHFTLQQIEDSFRSKLFNAMSPKDMESLREQANVGKDDGSSNISDVSASSISGYDKVDQQRDASFRSGKLESRRDQFEVFFEYAFEDIDGDGVAESIVRAVVEGTGKPVLLMRHRIEYLYPHGRRPHFDWHYIPYGHRYGGMGIPELLEHMQGEENAYYQSRSDILEIITKPGGLYDPMSGLAPDELRFTPGMFIKARLGDGPAMQPFAFPVDPTLLFREQSGIELMAERSVGSTDMGLGRNSSRPNAPRTLGGTAIVVRQQQLRTNVYLTRLLMGTASAPGGISEMLRQYKDMYAAFMPANKEYRALGTNEVRSISRAELQGRFDFVIDFGEDLNNPQLQLQNAMLVYDRAMGNPLIQQNPVTMWHITTRMMEKAGVRNAKKILPAPAPGIDRPPMEPGDIIDAIAKGIRLEPLPTEDHNAMMQEIQDVMSDQMRLATFPPEGLQLLEAYAEKTIQFAMAGASQQGGAGGQQQLNPGAANSGGGLVAPAEQVAQPLGGGGDLNL